MLHRLRAAIVMAGMSITFLCAGSGGIALLWAAVLGAVTGTDWQILLSHVSTFTIIILLASGFCLYAIVQWRWLSRQGSGWIPIVWPNAERAYLREDQRVQEAEAALKHLCTDSELWLLKDDRSVNSLTIHLPRENRYALLLTLGAINHLTTKELQVVLQHGLAQASQPRGRWHTRLTWLIWIMQQPAQRGWAVLTGLAKVVSIPRTLIQLLSMPFALGCVTGGAWALAIRYAGSWVIPDTWRTQTDHLTVDRLGSRSTFLRVLSQAYEHNEEFPSSHLAPWSFMTFALPAGWNSGSLRQALHLRTRQIKSYPRG